MGRGEREWAERENLYREEIDWESITPHPGLLDLNSNMAHGGLELSDQAVGMVQRISYFRGLCFELSGDVQQPKDARYFGIEHMIAQFRYAHVHPIPWNMDQRYFKSWVSEFWHESGCGFTPGVEPGASEDDDNYVWRYFKEAISQPSEERQLRITELSINILFLEGSCGDPHGSADHCDSWSTNGVTLLHLLQGLHAWDED